MSDPCLFSIPEVLTDSVSLVEGDALETLRSIPDGDYDLVVTSPPYNLGGEPWPMLGDWKRPRESREGPWLSGVGGNGRWKTGSNAAHGVPYGEHSDTMPWPEYVEWQRSILRELWRIIPDDGAICYNHKPRVVGAKLWLPLELIPEGVILRQNIIWARPGGMNFTTTAFVPTHEWIMLLAKPGFRLKSQAASGLGDVWRINPEPSKHPAPFPLELARRCIEPTTAKRILDPFGGSGTVGIAAAMEGRTATLIELDPKWCAMIRARTATYECRQPGSLFDDSTIHDGF